MVATININNSAVVKHTNTLEKIHKSALPIAIRGTLNKTAFDVKQITMPSSADRHFIRRKQNFFKANSRVEMAVGFTVSDMRSTVGFIPTDREKENFAVRELEQQERGGDIGHRTFIPLDTARSGNSGAGLVRPGARLSSIKNIVDSSKSSGATKKEQFVRAAIFAGKGGFVIGNIGRKKLYEITAVSKMGRGQRTRIKSRPIYSFDLGRSVDITATHFMAEATIKSAGKMERFYIEEANRQIQRISK